MCAYTSTNSRYIGFYKSCWDKTYAISISFVLGQIFLNRMSWQTLHDNISKINIRIKNQLKNEHATAYTNKMRKAKENDWVKISESYLHK